MVIMEKKVKLLFIPPYRSYRIIIEKKMETTIHKQGASDGGTTVVEDPCAC